MEQNTTGIKSHSKGITIPPDAWLVHWQGHRRLTRRMIELYPDEQFFNYSLAGMRPFSGLVMEMIRLSAWGMRGINTGDWTLTGDLQKYTEAFTPSTKADVLKLWDEVTQQIDRLWPEDFQQVHLAFGQYESPVYGIILYWIDNEIHHRGQAYVYLRSLGIEPPPFWER
jgi:uncharacterized damage-inducible protein DinB